MENKISIIGAGNIGLSIAEGLVKSKKYQTHNILLSRRDKKYLKKYSDRGFIITDDNKDAVIFSNTIIIAVGPRQLKSLSESISNKLTERHLIISVVSGISIDKISSILNTDAQIVRAMPNTASSICESMTCISSDTANTKAISDTESIFKLVGRTLIIKEEKLIAATSLGACGIAFFLRAVRAASQGGIEIGFHSDEAFLIAAQTAKGASALVLNKSTHPESEIDNVTTPRGATISGLNEMEHQGFSSAMIKGIITSTKKINTLLDE